MRLKSQAEMDAEHAAKVAADAKRLAQDRADLRAVMQIHEGRRLVWRILGIANVFGTSFAGEQPLTMSFREGARNVGLQLFADLQEWAPEEYLLMAKEAAAEVQQDATPAADASRT